MAQPIILTPLPVGAGQFYSIAGEYPSDPFLTWFKWINYPWMFPSGVGRFNLPDDPVVPLIGG